VALPEFSDGKRVKNSADGSVDGSVDNSVDNTANVARHYSFGDLNAF
jgi:hypothetical protein